MSVERRAAARRDIDPLEVTSITSLDSITPVAKIGHIVNASSSGFKLQVHRTELVPKFLRETLDLSCLVGEKVLLHIAMMNLEIAGVVVRASHVGHGLFDMALDYTEDAPLYWRECLLDLLPEPGEFEDLGTGEHLLQLESSED
jgi:hypothetical protein